MKFDPNRHHRRSIRLPGYDYTRPGAYFITICTHERAHLFGAVVDGEMRLNEWGRIVRDEWFKTAQIRPHVQLWDDEFVVMPNHIHGIIWIVDDNTDVRATRRVAPTPPTGPDAGSIGAIIGQFKSAVTKRINQWRGTPGAPVWQRNYYEHIIRDERALNAIRCYIGENPLRWHLDRYNPERTGDDPLACEIWNMINDTAGARHTVPLLQGGMP
jgi:REP element-mobilizing transposase RayT